MSCGGDFGGSDHIPLCVVVITREETKLGGWRGAGVKDLFKEGPFNPPLTSKTPSAQHARAGVVL